MENIEVALAESVVTSDKIYKLEKEINNLPQSECPVRHFFAPGMFAREMTIPAGTVLTGAVHKTEHLNIISKGRIKVMTEEGMVEICAPHTMISKPGIKRAGYAIEETVWTTIHATEETDIDKLVEELTTSKNSELLGGIDNVQLQNNIRKLEG